MKWVSLCVPVLSDCLRCVKLITGGVTALQTADPLHRQKHSDSARFDFFFFFCCLFAPNVKCFCILTRQKMTSKQCHKKEVRPLQSHRKQKYVKTVTFDFSVRNLCRHLVNIQLAGSSFIKFIVCFGGGGF